MTKKKDKKYINKELTNTWESLKMIEQQYLDDLRLDKFLTERNTNIIKYILTLPIYEKTIMILYMEYESIRKVAEETTLSYFSIYKIINKIKEEVKCL